MDFLSVIRLIAACLALSLCITKLVHKDKHTAVYWAFVTIYWSVSFIEHMVAIAG